MTAKSAKSPPPVARALVVAGMHRSGTSAMTRLLSLAGAALPEKIMLPGPDNPVGFWEPYEAVALNDDLLASVDSAWDDIFAVSSGPRVWDRSAGRIDGALKFLDENFREDASLVALKDPRSSVLARMWDEALRARGFAPAYVIMVRNPLEIAGSLAARDRFPSEKSALIWLSYMLAVERDTRHAPRVFVSYGDMLADWRGVLSRVEKASGAGFSLTPEAEAEIDAFLAPDLRHHAVDLAALDADPGVWSGVKDAYRLFLDAAAGREGPAQSFDAIRARYAELERAVGPVLTDMRRRTVRAERHRSLEDRALAARADVLQRELSTARLVADRAKFALDMVNQSKDALLGQIEAIREQADASAAAAADAASQLAASRHEMAEREQHWLRVQAHMQQVLDDKDHRIRALMSSTSWRVTAPLRKLSALPQTLAPQRLKSRLRERKDAALIAASGFFDRKWYLETNPDVAASGRDPLQHFLRYGWREGRNPGRDFDVAFYLRSHADIARARINPLAHYLRAGRAEQRAVRGVGASSGSGARTEGPRVSEDMSALSATPPGRVAVMVHAFYADVFDEICGLLAAMPARFTLLVSTPSEDGRRAAFASIEKHGVNADVEVRVTPNRGRNFAPLVVEFADAVRKHDYLLHLHTKKSLYTAAEQSAWRDSLYGALAADGAQLRSIFGLFQARPEVGLIYPAPFAGMPHWANHWLQNAHLAGSLFARLGVGDYDLHGYIDYPVGGMFWAKVEAIRPLLDAGFDYADFPEEAGQTDGTLAHAIERSFVELVRSRGYQFAEADRAEGVYRVGWSDKNLGHYKSHSLDGLKAAIDAADVVSFDIFDTLTTRPALNPDAVQRYVGFLLARHYSDAPEFFTERKAAEHRARAARDWTGDVGLAEIYAAFDKAWSPPLRAEAQALERSIEARIALPRAEVVEAAAYARAQGKTVVAVSDTYFDPPAIEAILEAAGASPRDTFEAIHLSSELGLRKDRGDVWPHLAKGAGGRAWLHIGDNEMADIQRVADLGWTAYHVANPQTILVETGVLPRAAASDWKAAILLGPAGARLAAGPFPSGGLLEPLNVRSAHDLGYAVFGPAIFAFLAWLVGRPEMERLDRLHFLAREGWVLRPAYDAIRDALGGEQSGLPASNYLYASRRSVLMAGQAVSFDPEAVLAGRGGFHGSIASLVRGRLGYAAADEGEVIGLPADAPRARDALARHRNGIVAQATAELSALRAFLSDEAVTDHGGVVDIGYSATIQKGLQKVLGHGLAGFYMATFSDAAGVVREGGSAVGCFLDEGAGVGGREIEQVSLILEAFLTAPDGQVDHFETSPEGAAAPVFKPSRLTEEQAAVLAELHGGALAYVGDLLKWYGPDVVALGADPAFALAPLQALARGRLRIPASTAPVLKVDDAFCGREEHEVGAALAAE